MPGVVGELRNAAHGISTPAGFYAVVFFSGTCALCAIDAEVTEAGAGCAPTAVSNGRLIELAFIRDYSARR